MEKKLLPEEIVQIRMDLTNKASAVRRRAAKNIRKYNLVELGEELYLSYLHEKGKNIRDINRFTTDRGSFYAISIILDDSKCDIYLFNGDDGKILFKTREESEWYPDMSDENVYDKYLRSIRSGNYGK